MSTEEPPSEGSPEPEPRPRRRGFRTGRLEAFSDGVFAIAVTLLILDIGVSGTASHDLGAAIRGLWPSYLAYVVLIVSGLWRPVIAVIGFLGIALYYIIPFRRLSASVLPRRRHRKRAGPRSGG
jgi:hypothetical protein